MLAYSASGLGGKKTARGPLFVNTVSITEIFANGFHYFSNKKAVCFLLDRKGFLYGQTLKNLGVARDSGLWGKAKADFAKEDFCK